MTLGPQRRRTTYTRQIVQILVGLFIAGQSLNGYLGLARGEISLEGSNDYAAQIFVLILPPLVGLFVVGDAVRNIRRLRREGHQTQDPP